MEDLSKIVASKLVLLRKTNSFTQLELAEKLNYSDKAISKWEHGESLPPIDVLYTIAKLYGTTLDYLVTEYDGEIVPIIEPKRKTNVDDVRKMSVTLLGMAIVYFMATIIYIYIKVLRGDNSWEIFVYAMPFCCIVTLVFNLLWGKKLFTFIILSILIWSIILSFYLILLQYNLWAIFIIGAPAQIIIILCAGISQKKVNK